jgi:hypothetical protein
LLSLLLFKLLHLLHLLAVSRRHECLLVGELVALRLALLLNLSLEETFSFPVPDLCMLEKVFDVSRFLVLKTFYVSTLESSVVKTAH